MRAIEVAQILTVGSELTTGETRDTNAGDLAGELTEAGVVVERLVALPDDLAAVRDVVAAALGRVDLVVATGGLGPTPDDLTREAIGAAIGEEAAVDPELEGWLRGLFERRGLPFVEANRKQAWLLPSATAVPNPNGTAPGWWVDRPDGRVVVALPGPPREMRPMWHDWVLPRLAARGLGRPMTTVTLRTTGIGESLIADRLGPLLARDAEPLVATYARADAVDVRISAHERAGWDAAAAVAETERAVTAALGDHVWARGDVTWPGAIGDALDRRGWRVAVVEVGTRGSVASLLGEGLGERLTFAESLAARPAAHDGHPADLPHLATRVAQLGPADVGLAVEARPRRGDTAVSVAIEDPRGGHHERRLVFLDGPAGRGRAALAAAAILLARLRAEP
ncbi:MAG TPA: molybdopterin-binding protein [Candidatus Limnocylindrales bacterium]|nr:molybdopterin-binding protein [Candidatus Limnocylindrales bacterium]